MSRHVQPLVLVAEAAPGFLRLVRAELEERGFRVLAAETGAEALRLARSDWPDVGVLSLRLPDMDGFTLLQRLRNWKELSTIFVGRGNSRGQAVEALDAGADDYLTWPFNPEELVARLRALLRRAQGASRLPPVLQEGGLQIDLGHARVTRRGQTITLTPTEWRLLVEFITHPRQVLSYRELLPRVSPHALARRPGLLRSWVWRLRNKLEADPDQPALIKTVPGMGYLFDIEIYRAPGSLAPAEPESEGSHGGESGTSRRIRRRHAVRSGRDTELYRRDNVTDLS